MKAFQLEYLTMAGSINKSMRVRECEKCPGNSKYLSLNRSLVLERERRQTWRGKLDSIHRKLQIQGKSIWLISSSEWESLKDFE